MEELQPFIETDIPDEVMMLSLVGLCVVVMLIIALNKSFAKAKKGVLQALLIEYVAMVFCSTVLCRQTFEDSHYELYPFYSYEVMCDAMFWQVVLKVALFVPIGMLLGGVLKGRWKPLACGSGLSISIELLQLVFRKGVCETDDVIHNFLGVMIGLTACRFVKWTWRSFPLKVGELW